MSGQKDCGEYCQSLDTEVGALSGHWTYQAPDDSRPDPTVPYIRTAITSTIPGSGDHFLKVDQLPEKQDRGPSRTPVMAQTLLTRWG